MVPDMLDTNFEDCIFGVETILPDKILTKLTAQLSIQTTRDLATEVPEWDFADEYGAEILYALKKVDDRWKERVERDKIEKKIKREREVADRRALQVEKKKSDAAQRRIAKHSQWTILTAKDMASSDVNSRSIKCEPLSQPSTSSSQLVFCYYM